MRHLLTSAAAALLLGAAAHAEIDFAGCGQIVMGVECPLFAADAGGLYVIAGTGFEVGDRVHIVGKIDPFCITFCQQGDGCLAPRSMTPCSPPCPCDFDGTQGVTVFDLLAYLDLWFTLDQAANMDDIPEVDIHDLLAFLDCWFVASAGGPCP